MNNNIINSNDGDEYYREIRLDHKLLGLKPDMIRSSNDVQPTKQETESKFIAPLSEKIVQNTEPTCSTTEGYLENTLEMTHFSQKYLTFIDVLELYRHLCASDIYLKEFSKLHKVIAMN